MTLMVLRALDRLIDTTPPRLRGRDPYWRPTPPPCSKSVREPAWSWRRPNGLEPLDLTGGVTVLDANAAYLAAASTVEVAHGRLINTKGREFDPRVPGYWHVEIFPWLVPDIVSPLGTAKYPDLAWLTTPTVALLARLVDDGYWPEIHVTDSWTSVDRCRLRHWSEMISGIRREALLSGDRDAVESVKLAYSQAITTMGIDKKSMIHRPDWSQHIRTQHAANMWRKMWSARGSGLPVLGSSAVDEIVTTSSAVRWCLDNAAKGGRPPLRIDPTGLALGSFKVKKTLNAEEWSARESG
ncbi:MAG: hypothetical protein A2Y78_10190 [Acidobacteria bacterium RBG_13_68_16]|nr:MAG: hypothetical protein A2Y78_10190 [Acidobacteria bacterium RBG_13_68_16]